MAQFEFTWEAPEYEFHEKGVSWYWISIIIAACIIAFSVWTRNFLFGLFVTIAEVMLIFFGNAAPRYVSFRLTDEELQIDREKHYVIREFMSWSAEAPQGDWVELLFTFRARFKLPVSVLISHDKLDGIRAKLRTVLPEVEHKPSLLDSISRIIRF